MEGGGAADVVDGGEAEFELEGDGAMGRRVELYVGRGHSLCPDTEGGERVGGDIVEKGGYISARRVVVRERDMVEVVDGGGGMFCGVVERTVSCWREGSEMGGYGGYPRRIRAGVGRGRGEVGKLVVWRGISGGGGSSVVVVVDVELDEGVL
jgi:hypothetical protein